MCEYIPKQISIPYEWTTPTRWIRPRPNLQILKLISLIATANTAVSHFNPHLSRRHCRCRDDTKDGIAKRGALSVYPRQRT